ncbi:hypothetical protein NP493_385g02003 [Ridgeia piscesae]|uniref:LITAF domain-containing protein n=1 Tax=Ridgeia piscesae TaxID=27915 RepID=A0AAD9L2R5_RIDPI|nr:hypothetical protein NP493_385g02003 [Ridgeia piscesae]
MVELPFAAPSEPEREGSTPDVARVPMPVEAVIQHTPSPAPPLYFDIIRDEPDESSTALNGSGNHLGIPARSSQSLHAPRPLQPPHRNPSQPQVWHTQSTTVVVNQPMPVERPGPVRLLSSSEPTDTVCFNCGQVVVTYLYHESGSCTYVSCVFLAVIGCDCGCCLLPFFMDWFKDAVHKCPKCHVILGKHKKL